MNFRRYNEDATGAIVAIENREQDIKWEKINIQKLRADAPPPTYAEQKKKEEQEAERQRDEEANAEEAKEVEKEV